MEGADLEPAELHVTVTGSHAASEGTDAPTLVLVHGFTQTGASWRPVAEHLGGHIVCVDAPGHGGSGAVQADLMGGAALLADAAAVHAGALDEPGTAAPIVVGYSMGGRLALRTALDHPTTIGGLVLLGATAGIDDPAERAERRAADHALADRIEQHGVAPFLQDWLAQPLFAGLHPEPDDLAARLANTAQGLASSLRLTGTGTMDPPWWDELADIELPTLVVWGERDAKFAALGARLAAGIGTSASTAVVARAGHAAHLEQPEAFATLVQEFAASLRG